MDNTEMLKITKLLLGINDESKDQLLQYLINDATQKAKNYCHIEDLPSGLETLIPQMAARAYTVNDHSVNGKLKSWTQGSRTETYEDSKREGVDWFSEFEEMLNPFRRRRGYVPSEIVY